VLGDLGGLVADARGGPLLLVVGEVAALAFATGLADDECGLQRALSA
jgi:hypothetical protein